MDPIALGLVALVCLVIGFLMASLIQGLRHGGKTDSSEGESPEEKPQNQEVVRVWRQGGGALAPEINGQVFLSAADLNADQHADLSMALVDLYNWLESSPYEKPHLAPDKELAAHGHAEAPPAVEGQVVPLGPGEPSPAATEAESQPRFSLNPFKPFIQAARRDTLPRPAAPEKSIATQIDEILQGKLAGTPLAGQGIRLVEWPVSGMRILFGGSQYDSIDEVPDEEVKALIQSAVAEWEARALRDT